MLAIFGGGPVPVLPALPRRVMPGGQQQHRQIPPQPCAACGAPVRVQAAALAKGRGRYCSTECRGAEQTRRVQERARALILSTLSEKPQSLRGIAMRRGTLAKALASLQAEGLVVRVDGGPWVMWRLP